MTKSELDGIVSVCDRWLKKELPYSVKNEVIDVRRNCKNELLKNELISLGYQGITESSSINTQNIYVFREDMHYHKHIIRWTDKCSVSWRDENYQEPIAGKFYVAITFSTGPYYICGTNGSYEKATPFFKDMWAKIVAYKPDSLDSHNCDAYFEIHREDAIEIWNKIDAIIEETRKSYRDYLNNDKNERIKVLEEEIKRIKEGDNQ